MADLRRCSRGLSAFPRLLKDFLETSSIDIWVVWAVNGPMGSQAQTPRVGATDGYLTVAQVALLLGVAKSFVYRRTSPHHPDPIPCYRFGGHLRFQASDIEAWAASHRKNLDEPSEPAPSSVVALDRSRGQRVRLRVREPRS